MISLPKLLADGVSDSFHTPVHHVAELCFLSAIMYSIDVVILSIAEKRLSAKLHIVLVIGTCIRFKITLEMYCRTLEVFYNTLNCVLKYLIKRYLNMYNIQQKTAIVLQNTQYVLEYIKLCSAVPYKRVVLKNMYPMFT